MKNHRQLSPKGIFASLSQDALNDLTAHGEFLDVSSKHTLIEQGAYQDELFFVISGSLEVQFIAGEKMTRLANIATGESIGEANLFFASSASAKVVSSVACELWKINKSQMASFVLEHKDAGMSIMAAVICLLSKRLHTLNERTSETASERSSYFEIR